MFSIAVGMRMAVTTMSGSGVLTIGVASSANANDSPAASSMAHSSMAT
jgi:hypothetical protein